MNESERKVQENVGGNGANNLPARYFFLFLGVLINSFAIELITKAALGTGPISTVPYVLSLIFPSLSFGLTTFIVNILFIALQIVLLRRDFQPVQLLQILVNVVFSWFIDVSAALLFWFEPNALPIQIAAVVIGCFILALGICIEVAPQVIVVPGEGAVRAIAQVTGMRFGTVKNCFDLSLAGTALMLSLAFFGEVRGLGVGTIISAILVGRFCNLINKYFRPLNKIRALSR